MHKILARFAILSYIFLSLMVVPITYAAYSEGSFFSYNYSVSSYNGREFSGSLSARVVQSLSDGLLRIRYEATFNDGVAVLEKNLPSEFFIPPIIDFAALEGSFSFWNSRDNVTYSFTVTKVGENRRTVGAQTYATSVYSLAGSVKSEDKTVSLTGEAETINDSNVVYRLSLEVSASQGKDLRLSLSLDSSNVDLRQFRVSDGSQTAPTSFASVLAALSAGEDGALSLQYLNAARLAESSQQKTSPMIQAGQASNSYSEKLALVAAVGVAALAVLSLFASQTSRGRQTVEGRKTHYV